MKLKWVATRYARKSKVVSERTKYIGTILLISMLFLINSCDKSDDLFLNDNESLIETDSTQYYIYRY